MNQEEFEAFLEHHGIKGQHWGIRRNLHPFDDQKGGNSKTNASSSKTENTNEEAKKAYLSIPPIHRNSKDAEKALAESQAKSLAKLDPSEAKSEKKRPNGRTKKSS